MASSTAWAGPTSSSAQPESCHPSCWRESRVLPTRHPEPWSPAQHLLGKLQPEQILPSSAVTPNRTRGVWQPLAGHGQGDSCQGSAAM